MPTGVYERTKEHKEKAKKTNARGEKHPRWLGDNVGKNGLHSWLRRTYGKPSICESCGSKEKSARSYQWANISGLYKRDRNDFKRLCAKCHAEFDKNIRPRGEKQGIAKLNEDKVRKIRTIWSTGKHTIKEIGNMFEVKKSTITSIVTRRNWRHVQ